MQRKECNCASIGLAKRRGSSRMVTADKISHGLEIRRGKGLGLFTRASLIGTLMRAGFFIAAMPILASAQTQEQIAVTQTQLTPRQAQKNADPATSQRDSLQAQLDAISQRDALQAQLEDAPLAAKQRDSLQNQPKTEEASQQDDFSAANQSQSQQEPQSATSEALPSPIPVKSQAENEQATASQNQTHRPPSESERPQRIHRARETKTPRDSAASPRATPFLSRLRDQWNRFWQRLKANP
jgi:hypothetical protein